MNENLPAIAPANAEWELLQRQCMAFIDSGLLPDHITKARDPKQALAKALTIAWKGRELGLPPLYSFSNIQVISGKPCLSAELMLALVFRRCPGAKVTFSTPVEKQNTECEVIMQRPNGDPQAFRFSIEDAKRAGLIRDRSPWTTYPAAMLRARAISAGARAVFPDCTLGLYTPEELGGEIIDAEIIPHPETTEAKSPEAAPKVEDKEIAPRKEPPKVDYPRGAPGWENQVATGPQRSKLYAMMDDCLGLPCGDAEINELIYNVLGENVGIYDLTKSQMQTLYAAIEKAKNDPAKV